MEKTLRKYALSMKVYFLAFLATLFFIMSLILFYQGFYRETERLSQIFLYILGCFSIVFSLYFLYLYKVIPKFVFDITENQLQVLDKKSKEKVTYKFFEIGDVFLYSSGSSLYKNNLVFRINSHTKWYHVTSYTNKFEIFTEEFLSNYFKYRTPVLLDKIEQGEEVEFRFVEKINKVKSSKRKNFNKVYNRLKIKSVILGKNNLSLDKDKFDLKSMVNITDSVLGFVEIKDDKGRTKLKVHEDNFFSLEVFLALYDCVLNDFFVEKEIEKIKKTEIQN